MGQQGNHANKPAAITTAANSQKFTLSFCQCIFGEGGKTKEKSKWWLTITSPCMSFCSSSHPPLHHIRVFSLLILFHQTFKPKRVIPNGRSRARTKLWPSLTKKKFNIITILNDDDCTSVPFFVRLFDGQLKWRSEGYFFLLKKLCTCEPRSRPSFSTIVSHDRSHIRPVRLIFLDRSIFMVHEVPLCMCLCQSFFDSLVHTMIINADQSIFEMVIFFCFGH